MAFLGILTGTGVTAGVNDDALYAGPAGGVVKVVREGDQVDTDPGVGEVFRTVANGGIGFNAGSGGGDGRGVSFNDAGLLTYALKFTDGSSGVFVTQLAPVPEPTAVLLVAGVAGVGGRVGRVLRRRVGRPVASV